MIFNILLGGAAIVAAETGSGSGSGSGVVPIDGHFCIPGKDKFLDNVDNKVYWLHEVQRCMKYSDDPTTCANQACMWAKTEDIKGDDSVCLGNPENVDQFLADSARCWEYNDSHSDCKEERCWWVSYTEPDKSSAAALSTLSAVVALAYAMM